MRKHPTSFTVNMYRSNYKNLDRKNRVAHILRPRYYITSPETTMLGRNGNPLEEGWKNLNAFKIGNDHFEFDKAWITAMRYLAKSRLWDIVITMLLEDAANSMQHVFGTFFVSRVLPEERQLVTKTLAGFSISKRRYDAMVTKIKKSIIHAFAIQPRNIDPTMLKRHSGNTLYDLWFFVVPDPQSHKIRFVLSEEYYSFKSFDLSYCYPIHATPDNPIWWVIAEQFERHNLKDEFYRWIEIAFERHLTVSRAYLEDGNYRDNYLLFLSQSLEGELAIQPFCDTVLGILSDQQRNYMMQTLNFIAGIFTQRFVTGPIMPN